PGSVWTPGSVSKVPKKGAFAARSPRPRKLSTSCGEQGHLGSRAACGSASRLCVAEQRLASAIVVVEDLRVGVAEVAPNGTGVAYVQPASLTRRQAARRWGHVERVGFTITVQKCPRERPATGRAARLAGMGACRLRGDVGASTGFDVERDDGAQCEPRPIVRVHRQ